MGSSSHPPAEGLSQSRGRLPRRRSPLRRRWWTDERRGHDSRRRARVLQPAREPGAARACPAPILTAPQWLPGSGRSSFKEAAERRESRLAAVQGPVERGHLVALSALGDVGPGDAHERMSLLRSDECCSGRFSAVAGVAPEPQPRLAIATSCVPAPRSTRSVRARSQFGGWRLQSAPQLVSARKSVRAWR